MVSSANIWACGIPEMSPPGTDSPPSTEAPPSTGAPANPETSAPPAPAPSQNRLPSDVLELDNWYLTLPTGAKGKPDTVEQPALDRYSSRHFRLNQAGNGVVFSTPAGGTTTKNSSYPRSELREMRGADKAAWSNTSGTHTLTARQAVTALPPRKPEIVTAQIHDSSDDVMQVRLEGKRLMVQYDDGDREIVMDPNYKLGTPFDVKIVAADRRVQVYYNGTRKAVINRSGSSWYFKSGSYLQTNTGKGDKATAVGEVVIYSLEVTHTS